ncbi:MAG: HAMP domain-containing histidine kinase [Flavisolibacter sp.]|nr:HAMP domain-containing histidine kinase [Flavisolibacter sp.]
MRSQTIRLGMLASALIIAAIIIFQLIWLNKIYHYEQKDFERRVTHAVRDFYEDIDEPIATTLLSRLISNPDHQTYIIRLQNTLQHDSIAYYIRSELDEENIFTDVNLGIYDAQKKQYIYQAFLPSVMRPRKERIHLPETNAEYSHLILFFPHRNQYILSEMNFWIISSVLLLFVLVLFSSSLYYFYQQKFLNETQKDFVNNFTHEFKTPVSVINLAAEVLENPTISQKPEKLARYASIVKYQGQYLQNQIEQLLKHAFADTHLLHLQKEKVNLHDLINEALDNLQPLIQQKNATITCQLEAEENILTADKGYLLVVVTNLLDNALKYAQQPRVIIHTHNENNNRVLSIRDNGRGIEKKYLKRIFKKFYCIKSDEQMTSRGFGLGLAFVKRIVSAHHGKVYVHSVLGIGSDFQIKLPLEK